MSELLASIRADLTDRRLLPVVALVGACLVAALAYALLGGSSSSTSSPGGAGPAAVSPSSGLSATVETPDHAVAETTDGTSEQKSGSARNPFTPLVATTEAPASGSSSSSTTPSSSSTSTGSGSTGSGSSTPSESGTTTTPSEGNKSSSGGGSHAKKPKTAYDVTIEFGTLPPGITPETAQLTQYTKLKLQAPLPDAQLPLLYFRGVTAKGAAASFTINGVVPKEGAGSCLPSNVLCEEVDLKPGETEQFEYFAPEGAITIYELRVLSIKPETSKAKDAKAARWAESRAGRALLRASGLLTLPDLRYSSQPGVLVFAAPPRKASASLAHVALAHLALAGVIG